MTFYDVDNRTAFVCECDTVFGTEICRRLATGSDVYKVSGSVRDETNTNPKWVSHVVNRRTDSTAFKAQILLSDVVVCPLTDTLDEAFAAVKILSTAQCNVEKTLVLVSSVMTWARTNSVARELAAAEAAKERAARIAAGEDEPEPQAEPEEIAALTEEDYRRRAPHQRYNEWKNLEQLCKKANSDTLHTYIIWSGLQYGNGEDKLNFLFRRAYMNQATIVLPNFNGGKNVVPTIHVADLASLVHKVATQLENSDRRYYLAVDEGNNTWESIVGALGTLSNSKVGLVMPNDYCMYPFVEHFTCDMKMDMGSVGDMVETWVCRTGLVANLQQIWKEYTAAHNLAPMRVLMVGPPLSGKSIFSALVATKYGLTHLTISDIIQEYEIAAEEKKRLLQDYTREKKMVKMRAVLEAKERVAAGEPAAGDGEEGEAAPPPPNTVANPEEDAAPIPRKGNDLYDDLDDPELNLLCALDAEMAREAEGAAPTEGEGEEDEKIAKLKGEAATMAKVVAMKHKLPKVAAPQDGEAPAEAAAEGGTALRAVGVVRPWVTKGVPNMEGRKAAPSETSAAPRPELDDSNIGRYLDRAVAMMTRWRLSKPDCCIQGYVLDGFPKTARQARLLFKEGEVETIEAGEDGVFVDDEPTDEPILSALDDDYMPRNVFVLRAPENFLLNRLYTVLNTVGHNTLKDYYRRQKVYQANTNGSDPRSSLFPYYQSVQSTKGRDIVVRSLNVGSAVIDESTTRVVAEVEAVLGAPHNLGPTALEIATKEEAARIAADSAREQAKFKEQERVQFETKAAADDTDFRAREAARVASAKQQIEEMRGLHDEPLRPFLMANVIPAVTAVLRELAELRPENPVDYVSDRFFSYVEDRKSEMFKKKK